MRYSSTFAILRPQNLGSGNRKLFYDFGNRGNKYILRWLDDTASSNDPSKPEHFGNGFLMRQGFSIAWNGWDGDAPRRPNMMTIDLPVAKNATTAPNYRPRRRRNYPEQSRQDEIHPALRGEPHHSRQRRADGAAASD